MKGKFFFILLTFCSFISSSTKAQIDENEIGAWYMYFFNTTFKTSSWGIQGDIQNRNWNIGGDLEQLLLRGGLTYKPKNTDIKFTLGYGNVTTGAYGSDNSTTQESRIYQEALFSTKITTRFSFTHRFRYEQRFVENQDFRTRYRYNLFLNILLNNTEIDKNTLYLSFYNEIFINGQRDIGEERVVEVFDRNRTYLAIGYVIRKQQKIQVGIMKQTTDNWEKNQIQISLHQTF